MAPKRVCVALACAIFLVTQPLSAQSAQLISDDLKPRRVTVLSMDGEQLNYIDPNGAERTLPADQVLRLEMIGAIRPGDGSGAGVGMAWLVDGQQLAGRWGGVVDDETIRWVSVGGAVVELSLDDVLAVSIVGSTRPGVRPEDDDVLGLVSGEQLTGFIEELTEQSVAFVIGQAEDAVPLPLDRVAWLAIANDPEPMDEVEPGSAWVTLADGSRLLVAALRLGRADATAPTVLTGRLRVAAEQSSFEVPLSRVATIQPAGGALRLVPLGQLNPQVVSGGEVFGLSVMPQTDERGRLHLHAPVTLGVDLPAGAQRLTLTASLDLGPDIPAERARLAGMDLVIWQGDSQIARYPIDADRPTAELNLPLASEGAIRIELDPGVNGPVLDRLVLESAEVLIGPE